MTATVRRYEGVTDPAEAGRRVREGFVPLISRMEGSTAYYWVDVGNGVMVSTSVFETRAEEETSTERASGFVRENWPVASQPTAGHGRRGRGHQIRLTHQR